MFSYRHGFHAGNHADVLKHAVLIAVLKHLTAKPTPISVVDTHAGAGLYRLDDDFANTSGEAREGIVKLRQAEQAPQSALLSDYLTPERVAFVEWPGAAAAEIPRDRVALQLRIEHRGGDRRLVDADGRSDLVDALREALS